MVAKSDVFRYNIPAEELPTFNSHIIGLIVVIREFGGDVTKSNDFL